MDELPLLSMVIKLEECISKFNYILSGNGFSDSGNLWRGIIHSL